MPVFLGGAVIFRLAYPTVILRLAPRHSEAYHAVILNEVKNLFSDASFHSA